MTRRPESDSGFTLVELLVGIILTGIITATITAAIVVGLRTADGAADRLDESHDAQLVPTYLTSDLQSAYPDDISTSSASTGCAGPAATGTHVLSLKWSEQTVLSGPTQVFRSSYWLDAGPEGGELVRYTCVEGQTPVRLKLTRNLAVGSPTVTITGPRVTMRFVEVSGYTYSVTGYARTPGTVPVPPLGCGINTAVATPNPATRANGGAATALTSVSVVIDTYGSCAALKLTYQPDGVTTQSVNPSPNAAKTHWTTTLSGGAWTDGTKPLVISDGSGPTLSTINLAVAQACGLTAAVTPATVMRASGASATNLITPFTISATSTGACAALTATFNPDGTGTQSVPLTQTAPGVWSAIVAANAYTWTGGPHTITVTDTGGASGTATLQVNNGCLATLSLSASTVLRQPGAAPNGLGTTVTATAVNTTNCSGLQIRFTPNATVTTKAVGAGNQAIIGRDDYAWTDGAKAITLTDGTVDYDTKTLTVSAGCSVSQLTVTSSPVARNGGNGNNANKLKDDVTVKVLPDAACGSPAVLKLTFNTGVVSRTINFTKPNNQTNYQAVISKNDDDWTAGDHTLTIVDTNSDPVTTTTLKVT